MTNIHPKCKPSLGQRFTHHSTIDPNWQGYACDAPGAEMEVTAIRYGFVHYRFANLGPNGGHFKMSLVRWLSDYSQAALAKAELTTGDPVLAYYQADKVIAAKQDGELDTLFYSDNSVLLVTVEGEATITEIDNPTLPG